MIEGLGLRFPVLLGEWKGKKKLLKDVGVYRDNGREKGNYYSILGLYRDDGTENEMETTMHCFFGCWRECLVIFRLNFRP